MQGTQVQSLDQEDPLEKEWQPTPVFLPGKSQEQRSLDGYNPRVTRVGHDLTTKGTKKKKTNYKPHFANEAANYKEVE